MNFSVIDIIRITGAEVVQRGAADILQAIAIDSRTFPSSAWFVAIKGPHFDGHDFLAEAIAKGSTGVIVDSDVSLPATGDRRPATAVWCLKVSDTVTALGAIAKRWRAEFARVPCIAITGSNGKSTTKEMIAAVVSGRGPVLKTEGNFNNLIGLPLTVFRWDAGHQTAVVEMGMSATGEIAALTAITAPDVGVITNVTAAHLEALQTVENVAAAKGELFATMRRDGIVCINMEDPFVRQMGMAYPGERITYGMQNGCDVQFGRLTESGLTGMDLTVYLRGVEHRLHLPVPGTHNVMNAMATMAVGLAVGIAAEEMCHRIAHFQPMRMRMERVQLANGVQVINDSYNANPDSMEAALRTVGAVKRAGRFVAVFGDMLELGPLAEQSHRALGTQAHAHGVQYLFVTGDYAKAVADGAIHAGMPNADVTIVPEMDALRQAVRSRIQMGDVVLVKGSRGMRMERVVEFLKDQCGTG